jgi:hypothetical protein
LFTAAFIIVLSLPDLYHCTNYILNTIAEKCNRKYNKRKQGDGSSASLRRFKKEKGSKGTVPLLLRRFMEQD